MGINVEFNPDLALRDYGEFRAGRRKEEECIPDPLEVGKTYAFLKKGFRNYWFFGEIPLLETEGEGRLSRPKASIVLLEATHFLLDGEAHTKGKYKVVEVFDDGGIHFEAFDRVK
ncbi:MAG: hypothetical protein JW834_01125 [Candidatus Diapherotrites archaeon]|nr:hypothetical protein [Candidatus Diapherotrites archaeon]